jgi:hypothetical protein
MGGVKRGARWRRHDPLIPTQWCGREKSGGQLRNAPHGQKRGTGVDPTGGWHPNWQWPEAAGHVRVARVGPGHSNGRRWFKSESASNSNGFKSSSN